MNRQQYFLEWESPTGWQLITRGIAAHCLNAELKYGDDHPKRVTRIFGEDDAEVLYIEDLSVKDVIEILPSRWFVCPRCEGKGTHLRPGMENHCYSAEEFDREFSSEEKEMYFNGGYDIQCQTCHGRTTVTDVDEDMAKWQYPHLFEWMQELATFEYEMEMVHEAERRMGA